MSTVTLANAAGRYQILRGLLLVPTGGLLLVAGLMGLPPIGDEDVPSHAVWFLPAAALAGVALVLINRYYVTTFGRAEPLTRTKVQVAVYTVLATVVVAIGILVDFQADLPISLYGATFALSLLLYYRATVGLAVYHWVFLGGLTILSLLPVWGDVDDKATVAMIPVGLAMIGVGLCDHRELVRGFAEGRAGGKETADAA